MKWSELLDKLAETTKTPETKCMCKEFQSAKIAATHLGVSASNIAKCCKGKYKTTGGYHWKYADTNLVRERVGDGKWA